MKKWIRITQLEDGFAVLTGYDESLSTTIYVKTIQAVMEIVEKYLSPPEVVSIFVAEKPIGAKGSIG